MPLVYIGVTVMMALVLYFGFTSLSKIFLAKETTEVSKFVLDLQDEVELIHNYDTGSSKKFSSIALPKKVTHVCFFDPSRNVDVDVFELDYLDENLKYYLETSIKENLFLVPLELYNAPYPDYYVAGMKLETRYDNPLCLETSGEFEVVLNNYFDGQNIFVGVAPHDR